MAFNRMGTDKVIDIEALQSSCIAVVDTSIILLIAQNLLRYEDLILSLGNCVPTVVMPILNELKKLASTPIEKGRLALWALNNLLDKFSLLYTDEPRFTQGDNAIIEVVKELRKKKRVVVVTADNKLKREMLRQGIDVVWYRRAKNRLESANLF